MLRAAFHFWAGEFKAKDNAEPLRARRLAEDYGQGNSQCDGGGASFDLKVAIVVIEFIEADFAAEGVAMDAEQAGGARLIAIRAVEGALDEALLEFIHGFVE
jgi:hypothetical protein